jgi:prepilin-type N-terminal cleavage/methylation domain-containing protein
MKKALGFTLVEISVVLVVIGIIMGMAVKGRDLVETARLRKEIRKLDKFAAVAAVSYSVERVLPDDLSAQALKEGLLTKDDLEVNPYFNNSAICTEHTCVWHFTKAVTVYDVDNNSSFYRPPSSDDTGDVLLAVAAQTNDKDTNGYANSFVCKVEEYIDDKRFNGGMGAFFDNATGLGAFSAYGDYASVCSPSKNLLSGAKILYGYKVF